MSSLNLHLDFMNEQEPPVRYIELTAEEERQIMEDSTKLMRQIDDDVRVLDGMCSALENLFIIQRHYEEFGSSPALEALVGDIKQYLGVSLEADENTDGDAKDTDKADDKKGGGIGGAIKKVWDWIVSIFRRIGEWLNIVDKKADADAAAINAADYKPDKKYKIQVMALCYKDGQIVRARDEVMSAINGMKKALETSAKTRDVGNSSIYSDMYESFQKLRGSAKRDYVDIGGRQVKDLAKATYETFKGIRKEIPVLTKASEHLKDAWDGTTYDLLTKKKRSIQPGELPSKGGSEAYFVRMVKLGIASVKEIAHNAAICLASCRNVINGNGTQVGKLQTDKEIQANENKQKPQETKSEEKK